MLSFDRNDFSDTCIFITCADLDSAAGRQITIPVQVYGKDEAGNIDSCIGLGFIQVLDTNNVCFLPIAQPVISGLIRSNNSYPVRNADVRLFGSALPPEQTGDDGFYAFPPMGTGGDYIVSPFKNDDVMNGVSTKDIIAIRSYLLGVEDFDPHEMIAADVNHSEYVSAKDIIELRKLILGRYAEFPDNTSWRFVDGQYVFPDPSNAFAEVFPEAYNIYNLRKSTSVNFVGVKVGDVTGDASAAPIVIRNDVPEWAIQTRSERMAPGLYRISFHPEGVVNMKGVQFTLRSEVGISQVIYNEEIGVGESNFGMQQVKRGMITFSWDNPEGHEIEADNDVALFSIDVRVQDAEGLKDVLELTSTITVAEAYSVAGEVFRPELRFGNADGQSARLVLHQNKPNPFAEETLIKFELPSDQLVTCSIMDINGRLIHQIDRECARGLNEIVIDREMLDEEGIYYYRLDAHSGSEIRKMILLK